MSARITEIIRGVVAREGGYVNHPSDRGGPTKYGITEATARRDGYHADMRDLPVEFAERVYFRRYVTDPGFDRLAAIDEAVAEEAIDTGVVMGPGRAAEFLQRWLNGFNSEGRYEELFVDGRCGPATAAALRGFLDWRGAAGRRALLAGLNGTQAEKFLTFTEARRDQRAFLFGWVANRVLEHQA